jgi:hypothetical protein
VFLLQVWPVARLPVKKQTLFRFQRALPAQPANLFARKKTDLIPISTGSTAQPAQPANLFTFLLTSLDEMVR